MQALTALGLGPKGIPSEQWSFLRFSPDFTRAEGRNIRYDGVEVHERQNDKSPNARF
jgi:hypothetical protein